MEALASRETYERLAGKDVTERFASIERASEEEVASLSLIFHEKAAKIFINPTWIKLFTWMDTDRSGRISYEELEGMVRTHLGLKKAQLTDKYLQSLWVALDEDSSGQITAGEVCPPKQPSESRCPASSASTRPRTLRRASRSCSSRP